jgi:hypothetical protein
VQVQAFATPADVPLVTSQTIYSDVVSVCDRHVRSLTACTQVSFASQDDVAAIVSPFAQPAKICFLPAVRVRRALCEFRVDMRTRNRWAHLPPPICAWDDMTQRKTWCVREGVRDHEAELHGRSLCARQAQRRSSRLTTPSRAPSACRCRCRCAVR